MSSFCRHDTDKIVTLTDVVVSKKKRSQNSKTHLSSCSIGTIAHRVVPHKRSIMKALLCLLPLLYAFPLGTLKRPHTQLSASRRERLQMEIDQLGKNRDAEIANYEKKIRQRQMQLDGPKVPTTLSAAAAVVDSLAAACGVMEKRKSVEKERLAQDILRKQEQRQEQQRQQQQQKTQQVCVEG